MQLHALAEVASTSRKKAGEFCTPPEVSALMVRLMARLTARLMARLMDPTEAMFDHPLEQCALLTGFEQQVAAGQAPSVPDELANNPRARACFGAIRLVLGGLSLRLKLQRGQNEPRRFNR